MKPTATPHTDTVFKLPGGTDENDLPVTVYDEDLGGPCLGSTWVPTDEEREAIALGANVELIVFGQGHPPVAMRLADYKVPDYEPPYTVQQPTHEEDDNGVDDPGPVVPPTHA